MIYLELAEQGVAVAQLNAAILFGKYDIIDTSKLLITDLIKTNTHPHISGHKENDGSFNINKHLAFKYFSWAALQ